MSDNRAEVKQRLEIPLSLEDCTFVGTSLLFCEYSLVSALERRLSSHQLFAKYSQLLFLVLEYSNHSVRVLTLYYCCSAERTDKLHLLFLQQPELLLSRSFVRSHGLADYHWFENVRVSSRHTRIQTTCAAWSCHEMRWRDLGVVANETCTMFMIWASTGGNTSGTSV
jgi:hypothetical protein